MIGDRARSIEHSLRNLMTDAPKLDPAGIRTRLWLLAENQARLVEDVERIEAQPVPVGFRAPSPALPFPTVIAGDRR
jgi:hypothetical protein